MTLFELLIALSIISILALISLPHFENLSLKNQADLDINQLTRAINLAHSEAIYRHENMTLLPIDNNLGWSGGYELRIDSNNKIINFFSAVKNNASLTWSCFPDNVQYLTFTPDGFTNNSQDGSFVYSLNNISDKITVDQSGKITVQQSN